ncbi:MAG: hypothetical protein ACYDB9_12055 [Gammaproteobacteria bacterium]
MTVLLTACCEQHRDSIELLPYQCPVAAALHVEPHPQLGIQGPQAEAQKIEFRSQTTGPRHRVRLTRIRHLPIDPSTHWKELLANPAKLEVGGKSRFHFCWPRILAPARTS